MHETGNSSPAVGGAQIRGNLIGTLFLLPIRAYQRFISPLIAPRCRYYPTCSSYAVEAIRSYGVLRGTVLGGWRLLRCNPFSDGGFDAVEDQRLFTKRAPAPSKQTGVARAHTTGCGCDDRHKGVRNHHHADDHREAA